MLRINYGVCVEDWKAEVELEKEKVQRENLVKELSCLAHWDVRNVCIAHSGLYARQSDDYLYEFIMNGRLRATIYARRNDANTVDIITTIL